MFFPIVNIYIYIIHMCMCIYIYVHRRCRFGSRLGKLIRYPLSPLFAMVGDWQTLASEEAAALTRRGVRLTDLPGLRDEQLTRILAAPPSLELRLLRDQAVAHLNAELSEPSATPFHRLVPGRRTSPPLPSSAPALKKAMGGGVLAKAPTRWASAPQADQVESDKAARLESAGRAAKLLADLKDSSSFGAELAAAEAAGHGPRWLSMFASSVAARYDAKGVGHSLSCWRRWLWWRTGQSFALIPRPASPLAIELALFLEDVSRGGPTAAKGVMDGLKWLQAQLGLHELPLDSPLLTAYCSP